MRRDLYSEKLLGSLNKFVQQIEQLDKADNPQLVSKIVIRWTQAQPLLSQKVLEYILQSPQKIAAGEEESSIEKIIEQQLLPEFAADKKTLALKKLLYKKKLDRIYQQSEGIITDQQETYLRQLQAELELTDQQCEYIKSRSFFTNQSSYIFAAQDLIEPQQSSATTSEDIVVVFPQDKITVIKQIAVAEPKKSNLIDWIKLNHLWLLLSIPLVLLLLLLTSKRNNKFQLANPTDFDNRQQNLCIDSTNRQSPRISLGEKLLTQKHQNLPDSSKIALYEGASAFARCDFFNARNKFKQSLTTSKNNPEALIYYNNAQAITQEHFKIAVSVPLGSKPEIAWEILRGVAQVQTETNRQGGIDNKLLLVTVVNDDNDTEIVRQVAKQLAADQHILAVVGHNDSNASLAGSVIYQQAGLVMISPTSSTSKLSNIGNYIFRTTPSVAVMANSLASYAQANSLKKIAVCYHSNSSSSSSFVQEFIWAMSQKGGDILSVECDLAQSNFAPQTVIQKAIAQNAQAILLAPYVNQMAPAIAVAKANQQKLSLLGNHSLYTFETINQGKSAVAGMVLTIPWLPSNTSTDSFEQITSKYWGGEVNWRTAMAHDATLAIVTGLKQSDTRSELQSILTQPDFVVDGASGKFSFHQGDRLGTVKLAQIRTSAKNLLGYKFFQLDQKIKTE